MAKTNVNVNTNATTTTEKIKSIMLEIARREKGGAMPSQKMFKDADIADNYIGIFGKHKVGELPINGLMDKLYNAVCKYADTIRANTDATESKNKVFALWSTTLSTFGATKAKSDDAIILCGYVAKIGNNGVAEVCKYAEETANRRAFVTLVCKLICTRLTDSPSLDAWASEELRIDRKYRHKKAKLEEALKTLEGRLADLKAKTEETDEEKAEKVEVEESIKAVKEKIENLPNAEKAEKELKKAEIFADDEE